MSTFKNIIKSLVERFVDGANKMFCWLLNPGRTVKEINALEGSLVSIILRVTGLCRLYQLAFPVQIITHSKEFGIPCPWAREIAVY